MTEQPGLYGKYIIQKADGSPVDLNADYLVLRLDKPENLCERRTAWFYADCIAEENPQFHADLKNRVMAHDLRIAKEAEEEEGDVDYAMCPNCGNDKTAFCEAIHGWYYSCPDCSNTWFVDAEMINAKPASDEENDRV